MEEAKIVKQKPIVSWWKSGDPCHKIDVWRNKLTDINVINTKHLSNDFLKICLEEKHRLFLHVQISGMGRTAFEPHIPNVKETFFQLKKLIDAGFPQKQILVVVGPILQNDNGLNALKLLLKLFSEYKELRLRNIRFSLLFYRENEKSKRMEISNSNILKRPALSQVKSYLVINKSFYVDYMKLIDDYVSIITVDKGDESLIGVRELIPFGYKNEWINVEGVREKIINYEKGNKHKPILNLLSESHAVRCRNRCLLCPWMY